MMFAHLIAMLSRLKAAHDRSRVLYKGMMNNTAS